MAAGEVALVWSNSGDNKMIRLEEKHGWYKHDFKRLRFSKYP